MTALIAGPLLGPGYLLLRDAVSTPRSYPTDSALGLGDAAPRAVPQDALLAALSPIVDGGVLVKAILLLALWAAGYGAAVLAREVLRAGLGPQLVATTVALWNPYVAERLLQGHWSLLTWYAALPWTALAAHRLRRTTKTRPLWGALAACFAAAGLTPTGAILAGVTALVLVGPRRIPGTLALLVVASAPWLTATALSGAGAEPSDPAGIAAFAARAEPGLGTLGSLAGLGGIWNADAVPDSRTTPLALLGTVVLLAIVASGVRVVARRGPRALLWLAAAAVLLPALAATPWGREVMEWLVVQVPGAGLLRDTQKYVALAMPAYALCAAAGCQAIAVRFAGQASGENVSRSGDQAVADAGTGGTAAEGAAADLRSGEGVSAATESAPPPVGNSPVAEGRPETGDAGSSTTVHRPGMTVDQSQPVENMVGGHARPGTGLVAALFVALLLLPLFDLAWGVGGALRPVHYPGGWAQVVAGIDGPGDVAVLPGGMFRKFPYSGKAPVLDPAPRLLPNDVLQTGALPVRGAVVAGEGRRAQQVETLLLQGGSPRGLAELGVGWVVVERSTPGPLGAAQQTLAGLEPVYSDEQLALFRVPGVRISESEPGHRLLAGAAHLVWALLLIGGGLLAATRPATRPTAA
ncbi:hypothetical protein [Nocardia sp. NPDC048505]|uniref:hypothetical protein n=1 Tax=unclassified Nocardia TaxID=2637762 RepID=UPI0033EEE33C